jgi:toxin ParE1/3/4
VTYSLKIQQEAVLDIQEAFEWYEKQNENLGFLLIEEIENCYQKLSERPLNYTSINSRFRRIKLNRFPYLIIFEIEDFTVIINSLFHAKRKPKF